MRGLFAVAVVLVGCGVAPAETQNTLSPDFAGAWTGRLTTTAVDSETSNPTWQLTVARVDNGFAFEACPGARLTLAGDGNEATWSGSPSCQQPTAQCPGLHWTLLSSALQLQPGPALSMRSTWEVAGCDGSTMQLAWAFEGTKDAPSARSPQP